jgi:Pyridoxamine 5'-phosphate oxidase
VKLIRDRPRTVDVDEFLSRPLFAHLSTTSAQGPRESPVWFLWEEEALWILASRRTDTFPIRIERDPRCAIGIVDFDQTSGRVQHVGFRGRAEIEPFDANRARRLLSRYIGEHESSWDDRFRRTLEGRDQELLVRFVPDTAVARDISYDVDGRGQASPLGYQHR